MKKNIILCSLVSFLLFQSCSDYLDITPKDRVIPETLEDYRGLLTSAYSTFPDTKSKVSVRTDQLLLNPEDFSASSYKDIFLWKDNDYEEQTKEISYDLLYRTIFYANEVIINGSKKIPNSADKSQLIAEAYALRAYTYFELVNLFSKPYTNKPSENRGVPLILGIDLEKKSKPVSLQEIYNQIEEDIKMAELNIKEKQPLEEYKYRFSKLSLEAFKARVYLYKGDWEKAIESANNVLNQKMILLDLRDNKEGIFPNEIKSPENIMALDYAINNEVNRMAIVSKELISLYDRTEDLRFSLYFSENNGNYKTNKGNSEQFKCSFRIGEILLLKVEALLRLNQEEQAKGLLKELAKKRYTEKGYTKYINKLVNLSGSNLWNEFMDERQREVAFEGYRWFDLRRYDQKEIKHTYDASVPTVTLKKGDPRYTIEFPKSAKKENPYLR